MEILIPGLILVALMIYASTRIKKSAAAAYEPETVETDDFVIKKPEGFLTVIGGDPRYVFESYSKDFGGEAAPEFRKATANITVYEEGKRPAKVDGDVVVSDINEKIGSRTYRVTESTRRAKNIDFRVFRKSAINGRRLFELEIVALQETTDEFQNNIESMLHSFELK